VKLIAVDPDLLDVSDELTRSGSAKQFEERLKASIEEIGLVEPLKVAPMPSGRYLVVDGTMRSRAIAAIRKSDPAAFRSIPAYVTNYEHRYEIRFQTDIYQDLLPSQLATLVEHLHRAEKVRKVDIARYIGVSPATLRNYTGLWRMVQRGGHFARIVELMDVGVVPSSNPYAWLRLSVAGVREVLNLHFAQGDPLESWIDGQVNAARQGTATRYTTEYVETTTGGLDARFYREDAEMRSVKRDLGLMKGQGAAADKLPIPETTNGRDVRVAVRHLKTVVDESPDLVLQTAARSLRTYLK
jgi:hypothetical protein